MPNHLSTSHKIIVVLGPTASGKSELAVKIARKFNGEIISADSRQVYYGLNIGSGKVLRDKKIPKSYFYKEIPHHLLDVASPKRTFTVAQYQKLAKKALKEIIKRGKIPIICGGTGLYIDALIYDYQLPNVPPQPKLRKQLEKKLTEELFQQLQKLDPRRAKNIDKNNRRRLIRALEIILTTKKPIGILRQAQDKKSKYDFLKIGIKKSPEKLKKLITQRLKKRIKQGLIEEVKNLHQPFYSAPAEGEARQGRRGKQNLSWKRLDDLGLEYRYISRYLRGLISKKEMIEILKKEIWRYTKRQMTWFKKDKKIHWIESKKITFKFVKQFLKN
ncbi:MAG: tRNA (adenosine(37)-N6)-dimethylallyltransferase MiaA [Patescibacteria group bacterium]|mgnify:CR=1 FL=1